LTIERERSVVGATKNNSISLRIKKNYVRTILSSRHLPLHAIKERNGTANRIEPPEPGITISGTIIE